MHLKSGRELLEKLNNELEIEDPLLNKFNFVMGIYENSYDDIYAYIQKGSDIEDFNPRWMV